MPSSQQRPASFISKLCNILRSKQHSKIIYWDTQLKGIRIVNQKRLEEVILPRYYRHNRFSSFVRQLNMYDFHKVHLADHKSIFLHSQFDPKKQMTVRCRKDHIHLIRRKVTFEKSNSERQQSHREDLTQQKENNEGSYAFFKSSKNYLLKQSHQILSQKANSLLQITRDQAFDELTQRLKVFKENKDEFQGKVKDFKKDKKYRVFLKNSEFVHELYTKLQIGWEEEKDALSQLSIEDELVFKTRRSLAPKSLKLVESGQLYFKRETIGNLLNL